MIIYYTDGSCQPQPRSRRVCGGIRWQTVVLGGEPGGKLETTNIRMEGYAIMAALKHANGQPCQIFTDSEFWINVITKWSLGWERAGWRKKGGEIKNLDIVKEVCPLYRASQATLTWTRGHAGDPGNELADQ